MTTPLTSPGRLRLKCMIWEPQPINVRPVQDVAMVHNGATIQLLPPANRQLLEPFVGEPQGIILKRKYHYRHTWLLTPATPAGTAYVSNLNPDGTSTTTSTSISAMPAQQIDPNSSYYTGYFSGANNTVPSTAEVQHQTFVLQGSIFGDGIQLTQQIEQSNTTDAQQPPGVAVFSYKSRSTQSEESKYVGNTGKPKKNATTATTSTSLLPHNETIMPYQQALFVNPLNTGTPNTQTGSSSTTPVTNNIDINQSIHWLCQKQQPLFQGEDFWVEFYKEAHTFDNPPTNVGGSDFYNNLIKDYSSLNPYLTQPTQTNQDGTQSTSNSVFPNQAVVEFQQNPDGSQSVIETSRTKLDLSLQAYYMIEMGGPTETVHRYIILLPYKDYPKFIHIGTVGLPFIDPKKGLSVANVPNVSRTLSTYNVDSRSLMEQDQLRITVRNHMGRIAIYFSGHEDNPWVIDRKDLQPTQVNATTAPASTNTASNTVQNPADPNTPLQPQSPNNFQNVFVPMIVPNQPIRIGGGNGKVSWCFAPLHYEQMQQFTIPQVIAVRGPATDDNINLYLREKANQDFSLFPSSKPTPLYFQYAEVYKEQLGTTVVSTGRRTTLPTQPTSSSAKSTTAEIAPKKDQNDVSSNGQAPVNKNGENLAALQIIRISTIAATGNPVNNSGTQNSSGSGSASSNNNTGNTTSGPLAPQTDTSFYVRFFYAQYTLYSGDFMFPVINDGNNLPQWKLDSCITPVSTGWRVNVPAGGGPTNYLDAVDVSQHVVRATVNQTYTDLARCDYTGSISFHIAPGQTATTNADGVLQQDQSAFLAALVNKTFTMRLYAWWEDGFMQCSGSCPDPTCCSCGFKNLNNCALFTGLVHGGDITVQSGRKVMDCQLSDYWKILADSQFINCPFYDGARDYNAVYDILQQAGFHDGTEVDNNTFNDPWAPAALVSNLSSHQLPTQWIQVFNGQTLWCQEYALPSAYDILQSPVFKFADQSHYDEAIAKITSVGGKVAYFDQYGVFHMDVRPDVAVANGFIRNPKLTFYASPLDFPEYCGPNALSQIILDNYKYRRAAADVYNEIQIVSTNPQGELLVGNDVNYASKFDPTSEGYLGYTKRLFQQDGVFGSATAVTNVINYYKGAYVPAILITFKCLGTSRLKAMDLVRVVGLKDDTSFTFPAQLTLPPNGSADVIVTSVEHDIQADQSSYSWNMNVETEWVYTGNGNSNS